MPSLSTASSPAAQHAREAATRLSLPLRKGLARTNGNVPGTGAGSSVDFQDHRAYVPGDDPRHIDWLAYARSGHYTMKLYREEVRPYLDVALDFSGSMFLDEAKKTGPWSWPTSAGKAHFRIPPPPDSSSSGRTTSRSGKTGPICRNRPSRLRQTPPPGQSPNTWHASPGGEAPSAS